MRYSSILLSALSIAAAISVQAGKFTDDMGHEFEFKKGDKFATRAATGAVSLYRFGVRDEITSIWGLWSIRGSDLDVSNPEAGSRYPDSDPIPEEVNWLATKNNLSPGCYTNSRGCFRWDNATMLERYIDEIDYILFIDNGNDGNMKTVTNETGAPVVFIDTFFDYHPDCRGKEQYAFDEVNRTFCRGRSMIDIVQKIEDLAIAMGVNVDTDVVNADKKSSCEAAALFTATMREKQEEGLRVLTSIYAVKKGKGENVFVEFRTFDPIDLWVPRTLEELGMPILHHEEGSLTSDSASTRVTGDQYFVDCSPGLLNATCNSNTLYPVDFWLFDSRSYLNVIEAGDGVFESLFPDKAILAGQHWHYARNDGPLSYDATTRMLNEMTKRMKSAVRMHPRTDCVAVNPTSPELTSNYGGGLDAFEYVCYNEDLIQKEYLKCPLIEAKPVDGDGKNTSDGDYNATVNTTIDDSDVKNPSSDGSSSSKVISVTIAFTACVLLLFI